MKFSINKRCNEKPRRVLNNQQLKMHDPNEEQRVCPSISQLSTNGYSLFSPWGLQIDSKVVYCFLPNYQYMYKHVGVSYHKKFEALFLTLRVSSLISPWRRMH